MKTVLIHFIFEDETDKYTMFISFAFPNQLSIVFIEDLQPTSNLSVVELQVAEEKPDCVSVSLDQIQSF